MTALKLGSVRLIYAVLRLILGSAVDDGILTRQQLAHFLQTAERVAVEYWVFFFLLARTGMRLGEALALQW